MARAFAKIAFTPSVTKIQEQFGSAEGYAEFLEPEAEPGSALGEAERTFIAERDGFYQASVSTSGWPYVQFRGGPAGFLKVLNERTIAYADFRGNRQYVSAGNLTENDKISMILMDYPNRRRLKIWGHAKLVDKTADEELVASLQMPGYRGLPERAVVVDILAMDWNCPQHIPQRLTVQEFELHLAKMRAQIAQLSEENLALKELLNKPK